MMISSAQDLIAAGEPLKEIPIDRIIRALEIASARFTDRSGSTRKAVLEEMGRSSPFSVPMIENALDITFSQIADATLRQLIAGELGREYNPDNRSQAVSRLSLIVAAGAIFQPAVNSLIYSLLMKSPVFVKCSSHDPVLLPFFVRAIREADLVVGEAAESAYLGHMDRELRSYWSLADVIIAFGSDQSVLDLRGRANARAKFIPHGHRVSISIVSGESLRESAGAAEIAKRCAYDVALYDQSGCLSPVCIYVFSPTDDLPQSFAALLAAELSSLSQKLPAGKISAGRAAAIQSFRTNCEFLGCMDGRVKRHEGKDLSHTVIFDPDPEYASTPLGRTVLVKPLARLSDLAAAIRPIAGKLQGVGLWPPEEFEECVPVLREMGASYICRAGEMQSPPLNWQNAGIPCLKSFFI